MSNNTYNLALIAGSGQNFLRLFEEEFADCGYDLKNSKIFPTSDVSWSGLPDVEHPLKITDIEVEVKKFLSANKDKLTFVIIHLGDCYDNYPSEYFELIKYMKNNYDNLIIIVQTHGLTGHFTAYADIYFDGTILELADSLCKELSILLGNK